MTSSKPAGPPAQRISEEVPALQKDQTLTVYQAHPLNGGAPQTRAGQTFLTPNECFFVRNHSSVPKVDAQRYRLTVKGMVRSPLSLSLDELRAGFPAAQAMVTLQCAGHRRKELAALEPIPGEIPWGADAMSTAKWRGVPLREILLAAGIVKGASYVAFLGLDTMEHEPSGFGGSIPLEKAMSPETLLAYEMNDEPLPDLHGFPLRVVVPGYIGARSVKWLVNINLQTHPSTNYFQSHAYKRFPSHIREENADWAKAGMLGQLPLNSVISSPAESDVLPAGPTHIEGYAIAGEGRSLERVEISVDGGQSWIPASFRTDAGYRWAWRLWQAEIDLVPARYQLVVRAWDDTGETQPEAIQAVWNWKGYLNNAWHRVHITVH